MSTSEKKEELNNEIKNNKNNREVVKENERLIKEKEELKSQIDNVTDYAFRVCNSFYKIRNQIQKLDNIIRPNDQYYDFKIDNNSNSDWNCDRMMEDVNIIEDYFNKQKELNRKKKEEWISKINNQIEELSHEKGIIYSHIDGLSDELEKIKNMLGDISEKNEEEDFDDSQK